VTGTQPSREILVLRVRLLRALSIALVLVCCASGASAMPTLKTGHPRLFINQADLVRVKAELLPAPAAMPAAGKIRLKFRPVPKRALERSDVMIFGQRWAPARNGIFIAHVDAGDTPTTARVLVALQAAGAETSYLAVWTRDVPYGEDTTISVRWLRNASSGLAYLSVNDGTETGQSWSMNWAPDQQEFSFGGRRGETVKDVELFNGATSILGPVTPNMPREAELTGFIDAADEAVTQIAACGTPTPTPPSGNNCDFAKNGRIFVTESAKSLALAYVLTQKAAYLASAKRLADHLLILRQNPDGLNVGGEWGMSSRIAAAGFLYDYLFTELGQDSTGGQTYRQALAAYIIDTVQGPELVRSICGALGNMSSGSSPACIQEPVPEDPAPGQPTLARDYVGSHALSAVTGAVIGLLAIHEEHPGITPLIETIFAHYEQGFLKARDLISVNGGHHFGFAYGSSGGELGDRLQMWQKALDVPAGSPVFSTPWLGELVYPYIYGLRADTRFPASGDTYDATVKDAPIGSLALNSAVTGNPYGQRFYEQVVLDQRPGTAAAGLWERLLYPYVHVNGNLTDLDLSRRFHVSGQVLVRDTWSSDAALLEFKSSSFFADNHFHFDQNSFTLFYKAPLLIDSGKYDSYGSDHWQNYYRRSIAHNTMLVFDPAEEFKIGSAKYSNDGGQWFGSGQLNPTIAEIGEGGTNRLAGVTAFEDGGSYVFMSGDASKAYASSKLAQTGGFVRNIVYLRRQPQKPLAIVFDVVRPTGSKIATSLLHSVSLPVSTAGSKSGIIGGRTQLIFAANAARTLTVRNNGGMLTVQVLLPEAASLVQVGGDYQGAGSCPQSPANAQSSTQNCQFLVRKWNDMTNTWVWTNFVPQDPAEQKYLADVGAWRIEIEAPQLPAAGSPQTFLNVMNVADNDFESGVAAAPTAVRVNDSTSASTEALQISGEIVVLFNKGTGPAAEHRWISQDDTLPVLATGLKKDTDYRLVRVSAAPGSAHQLREVLPGDPPSSDIKRSSADGVIRFESAQLMP